MRKISVLLLLLFLSACVFPMKEGGQPVSLPHEQGWSFTCENNSRVHASYSEDGETAYLQVVLPQVDVYHQALELKQAVSGSGARYVSTSNSEMSYEWHTKASEGVMSVIWNDSRRYSVICNLERE